jgi:hypothetical protein
VLSIEPGALDHDPIPKERKEKGGDKPNPCAVNATAEAVYEKGGEHQEDRAGNPSVESIVLPERVHDCIKEIDDRRLVIEDISIWNQA